MQLRQTVISTPCHWVAPCGLWMAQAVCLDNRPVRFLEGGVTAMSPRYSAVRNVLQGNARAAYFILLRSPRNGGGTSEKSQLIVPSTVPENGSGTTALPA